MYGMTPVGVFFTAIFPLVINGQALCQQLHFVPKWLVAVLPLPWYPFRTVILFSRCSSSMNYLKCILF